MNELEKIEVENQALIKKLNQLAQTEDSRSFVESAAFIRANNDMRIQNLQDIKLDIAYGAKYYGQMPEKYIASQDSIVKSYIEQINLFMKYYNDEFMNIKSKVYNAEEKQKVLIFKIRKLIVTKQLYVYAERPAVQYEDFDKEIEVYKKQIKVYEKILSRCDKEFEDCKNRRAQDFQDLFGVEKALAIVNKQNIFQKVWFKIKNKFNGYQNFSKNILQKHAIKINNIKTNLMEEYSRKIKENTIIFSKEIEKILEEIEVKDE